jgi:hypothetical protein
MDPITLAVGAGILAVGFLAGRIGRRTGRRQPPDDSQPVCGCGHHLAKHDRSNGVCHTARLEDRVEDKDGEMHTWEEWVQCTCRQYVGPEPVLSLWTPPIAAE